MIEIRHINRYSDITKEQLDNLLVLNTIERSRLEDFWEEPYVQDEHPKTAVYVCFDDMVVDYKMQLLDLVKIDDDYYCNIYGSLREIRFVD